MSRARSAIIVGAGFYGVALARHLAATHGLRDILVLERGPELMGRASRNNQARIHCGYHYPRSLVTAYRSRVNLSRFSFTWADAVKRDFTKIYAVARHDSKVTAAQFERFCQAIGAPCRPADKDLRELFNSRLIAQVYEVQEYAFDFRVLAEWATAELAALGVEVRFGTTVQALRPCPAGIEVALETAHGTRAESARMVFNCTYSGLNQIAGAQVRSRLKHEITEMALVEMPEVLRGLGVTVMDGPFFSAMPYPARGLHTLSHVRYTPHLHWADEAGKNPYEIYQRYAKISRCGRMLRDAERYMPAIAQAVQRDSLFEVKTVLVRNESDDGRPILFEPNDSLPGCFSVLGGKIDNIYDIFEKLDADPRVLSLVAEEAK